MLTEKRNWMMDYLLERGLNPAFYDNWSRAEVEYDKHHVQKQQSEE